MKAAVRPPGRMQPITIRIPDVMEMTGLCRSTVYDLIASGEIEAAKVGRSTVVFVKSLERFLEANRIRTEGIGFSATKVSEYESSPTPSV
jgi:excisionase family DNA binding protein